MTLRLQDQVYLKDIQKYVYFEKSVCWKLVNKTQKSL